MPRHPKYNHLGNRGSAWYGRQRLLETLSRYELWEELIDFCELAALDQTEDPAQQIKRLRYLGRACYRIGNLQKGQQILGELRQTLADLESAKLEKETAAIRDEKTTADGYYDFVDRFTESIPAQFARRLKTKSEERHSTRPPKNGIGKLSPRSKTTRRHS